MLKTRILDILIGRCSSVAIAVHTHPDGDAAGSGLALLQYLTEVRGKEAVLIFPDAIPGSLGFMLEGFQEGGTLVFEDRREEATAKIGGCDLLFCMDCNSFSRTAGMEGLLRASKATKVLVDHHLFPEEDAFDLVISETSTSSTSELLYWTLLEMPDIGADPTKLPRLSADSLLTGMTTDTNNFANSVFPRTLSMASALIGAGTDRERIIDKLYNSGRENRLRLMGFLLGEKMRISPEGVAYIILDKETQEAFDKQEGETEGFVNIPLSVSSVRMSLFLTEEEDKFRVSVRSKKGTSANLFASKYLNGGGHERASGGKLVFGEDIQSPEEAESFILEAIKDFSRNEED